MCPIQEELISKKKPTDSNIWKESLLEKCPCNFSLFQQMPLVSPWKSEFFLLFQQLHVLPRFCFFWGWPAVCWVKESIGAFAVKKRIEQYLTCFVQKRFNTYNNNQEWDNSEAATELICNILFKLNPAQEASCNHPNTNTPLENKLPYQGQNIKPMEYIPVNNQRETLHFHAPLMPISLV